MNELYIQKLIRLIDKNLININDIKDTGYKTEIQNRLASQ